MFEKSPPCPRSVERWVSGRKLDAEPGQLYSYSNINYCIAQLAIEKATGQSYANFVTASIARPLGITSWKIATLQGLADEPHYAETQGQDSFPYANIDLEALGAAGAWTSSSSDYVRFYSGIRGARGVPLLKADTLAQLIARPTATDSVGKPVYYGLGTNVRVVEGGRFNAWHAGSLPGTTSFGATFANGWTLFAVFNRRLPREARDAAALELDRALNQAIRKSGRPDGEVSP